MAISALPFVARLEGMVLRPLASLFASQVPHAPPTGEEDSDYVLSQNRATVSRVLPNRPSIDVHACHGRRSVSLHRWDLYVGDLHA